MLFALLHRPPKLGHLGLVMNVEDLPESVAVKLVNMLNEANERYASAMRRSG